MRNTLLIQLTDFSGDGCRWTVFDGQGEAGPLSDGSLAEAAASQAGLRLVVLVPSSAVLLASAKVPTTQRQRALRAVPAVLEDQLVADIETQHFALGEPDGEGLFPVAVTDRARMRDWLEALSAAGLQPDHLVPGLLALPLEEHRWTVWAEPDLVSVRTGPHQGFISDPENLTWLWELAAGETPPGEALWCGSVEAPADLPGSPTLQRDERDPLLVLADGLGERPTLDLLQGEFSRSAQWARLLRPWRATAALVLAALVVAGGNLGLQYAHLGREQDALRQQMETLYREAFPNARRVVDPRAQLEQQLKSLQRRSATGHSSFLTLVAQAGPVIRSAEGVEVEGASYRDGRLDLDLTAQSLQTLDRLKQSLSQVAGLESQIESATADADKRVRSRLRIVGVGS
jgi:general secretion pathway protein L